MKKVQKRAAFCRAALLLSCRQSLFHLRGIIGVGIIYRVVKSPAFFSVHSLSHDKISGVDHVPQFAYLFGGFTAFEEAFGFFIQNIEPVPCPFKPQVGANDTYIGTHDLSDFFDALSDKYHFFGRLCPLVVPFGNVLLIGEVIDYFKTMFGCGIGINDSFDQ